MRLSRRAILLATVGLPAWLQANARSFRGRGGGGSGGCGRTTQISQLTISNTSGLTTAAAGSWLRFGYVFKDGDIPSGAPQFLVSGVTQPFSWGSQTYHPSGALRSALFLIRTTFSLAPSGTQVVQVWSGGSAPSKSARTLTEVYAQSVTVNGVGAGTNFGLNGSWSTWLLNDTNNVQQRIYLDGAAGKCWGILTHFAQSQGGTKHGQLVCDHFIYALTDSSGNLGGFWYLPRVMQPFYNLDTPSKAIIGFTSLNWKVGEGAANNFAFPFRAKNFTWVSGSMFQTTDENNFYFGAGANYNMVGCTLATSGTLPAGLTSNQIWFVESNGFGNNVKFSTASNDIGNSPLTGTNNGTGTHTLTPILTCTTFGQIFGAAVDSTNGPQYHYFRGAGSVGSRPTLRMTLSKTAKVYWISTKLLPPWEQTLFGRVAHQSTFSYDWNTNSIGPLFGDEETPGDRSEIGLLSSYSAFHFYNQTANDDKILRSVAFSGGNLGGKFFDKNTYTIPSLGNPATTYTGFGTNIATTVRYSPGQGQFTGFTAPPAGDRCQAYTVAQNKSHAPEFTYYATLFYGEPQFLDITLEQGNLSVLQYLLGGGRNPSTPTQRYGVVAAWGDDYRTQAWAFRDVVMAAVVAPGKTDGSVLDPYGCQSAKYFSDLVDSNIARCSDIFTSSLLSAWAVNAGFWVSLTNDSPFNPRNSVGVQGNFWMRSYHCSAFCLAVAALQKSAALTFLNNTYAKWYRYVLDNWGGFHLTNYEEHTFDSTTDNSGMGWPPISADDHFGEVSQQPSWIRSLTSQGTSPGFSITFDATISNGVHLTEGDIAIWFKARNLGSNPPPGFTQDLPYYARGVSGSGNGPYTFDLATNKVGGYTPVFITSGQPTQNPMLRLGSPPAANVTGGSIAMGDTVVLREVHAVAGYMKAVGVSTDPTAVITDTASRMTANSFTFVNNDPKWAFAANF